jgi:hypothetical protein
MVKQCGPQLALVIPDARAERTKPQVGCFHTLLKLDITAWQSCLC